MKHNHDRAEQQQQQQQQQQQLLRTSCLFTSVGREVEPGTPRNKFNKWSERRSKK